MKNNNTFVISGKDITKKLKQDPKTKKELEEIEKYVKIISPIIKKRNELGLSQRELAALCDLPQSTIGRIETNANKASIMTLIKITSALGLTVSIK